MRILNAPVHSSRLLKFVAHSRKVLLVARRFGWLPAARYTNLRDTRKFERVGFLDISWRDYNYRRHLEAAKATQPIMTVARDIENMKDLDRIIDQARELSEYAEYVVVVPKDRRLGPDMAELIPQGLILGFSVPTRYGSTSIPPKWFRRPTHLLGGRPDIQRRLAQQIPVISLDCNRFTFDAIYGDYFDGDRFRPHPIGGYDLCIRDSLRNINRLWKSYMPQWDSDQFLSTKVVMKWQETKIA